MSTIFCAGVSRASMAVGARFAGISCALVLALTSPALAQTSAGLTPPLITERVNEANLVALVGNTRSEAKIAANDLGIVSDDFPLPHLLLQLRRSAAQEQMVDALIDQMHDPKSPNFHRWLNASEVGAQFGPAASDIRTTVGWLQQHGFTVNFVYPNGLVIDYSGTAGQVRAAFHTEIHNLSVNGVAHFANMTDPQIPRALAPLVVGPVSLHDFRPKPAFSAGGCPKTMPFIQVTATCYNVTPADLATIYNFNPVFSQGFTGQGQSIYLVEDSNIYHVSDWETFRSRYGLSGYGEGSLHTIHPPLPAPNLGFTNCENPGVNGDDVETTLDAEYASAAAPSAAIYLATCAQSGSTWGILIALENLLNNAHAPAPPIVSISYEECEAALGAAGNGAVYLAYQTGVMGGTSIFVVTGDGGAADCDQGGFAVHGIAVNGLASTPYNVAVGGTDFADTYYGSNSTYWNANNSKYFGSAKSYVPEIPWNSTCASQLITAYEGYRTPYGASGFCNASAAGQKLTAAWAGGGGPSTCSNAADLTCYPQPKPSWQTGVVGIPNDGVRDLPDVALFASGGPWGHAYVFCFTDPNNGGLPCDQNEPGFGTSFASPIMAGVMALINQWYQSGGEGNPNYRLYQLAGQEYAGIGISVCQSTLGVMTSPDCIFYDITIGDNDVACLAVAAVGPINCYLANTTLGSYGSLSLSSNSYQPAYAAGPGWDFASGLGSINVANLISNWSRLRYCVTCRFGAAPAP